MATRKTIKITTDCELCDGKQITFKAPYNSVICDNYMYINDQQFTIVDAFGRDNLISSTFGVWEADAMISVILDVSRKKAYIQNAARYTPNVCTYVLQSDGKEEWTMITKDAMRINIASLMGGGYYESDLGKLEDYLTVNDDGDIYVNKPCNIVLNGHLYLNTYIEHYKNNNGTYIFVVSGDASNSKNNSLKYYESTNKQIPIDAEWNPCNDNTTAFDKWHFKYTKPGEFILQLSVSTDSKSLNGLYWRKDSRIYMYIYPLDDYDYNNDK